MLSLVKTIGNILWFCIAGLRTLDIVP